MTIERFTHLNAQVLESVRSAIIVCDALDPEFPIVYMNPAFERLTGYGPEEVLGRNCRFLQGTDRDQSSRHTIRQALLERRAVRALVRNYRKDGSLFHNELFIDPVRDPDGIVTHFVGCQNAIESPASAYLREQAFERYQRLTSREREVFERMANGYSNKRVAGELEISPRTAEKHRLRVLKKMEVSNLTQVVRYAIALSVWPTRDDGAAHR